MSFEQYPYHLYALKPGADENLQDDEGNFVEPTPSTWFYIGKCRDEANGQAKTVTLANGENIVYAYTIFQPQTNEQLLIGSHVIVTENALENALNLSDEVFVSEQTVNGNIRLIDKVKSSHKTRLNLRLWV